MPSRVLVVDDERGMTLALAVRLRAAGYDVHGALDGASGIAAALGWRPQVIVLDIRMPDMDGFEVKRRLMAHPDLSATPVVFLSANAPDSSRLAARAAGAHAFLTKPYASRDVLAVIKSALERNAMTTKVSRREETA